jgi:hypothetical protein
MFKVYYANFYLDSALPPTEFMRLAEDLHSTSWLNVHEEIQKGHLSSRQPKHAASCCFYQASCIWKKY